METPEVIKRAMEGCHTFAHCSACPYFSLSATVSCKKRRNADALAYIQQLETQVPKWVSVEERLPEKTIATCLVYADGHTQVADWTHDKWGGDWWFYIDGEYDPEITHWMPLPEPPNESRSANQMKSAVEFAERKVIKE